MAKQKSSRGKSGKKRSSQKTPSLMACVESGDVAGVQAAVAAGVDLLDEMEDTSPLAIAVEKGNLAMVQALLDLGHNPNLGGIVVPLAEAARNPDMKILELLLERGAQVDEPGEEGETALMWAAGGGHIHVVQRLIAAGADVQGKDSDGMDVLEYANKSNNAEVIEYLLPHYPKGRQDKVRRQFHLLAEQKKKDAEFEARLAAINKIESKPKKKASNPLIRAFENGQHDQVLKLLAEGANPNEIDEHGRSLLGLVAGSSAVYTLFKPLLEAGANPNLGESFRPLPLVAWRGLEFIKILLDAGADPNWADADRYTALMSAATEPKVEPIRLLLEAGADPNAEDKKGHTALWYALSRNNKDVAEILLPLTKDADDARRPWRKNKEGKSRELCLLDAAKGGDLEFVQQLLSEGVPIDVADESSNTPLHLAAEKDDVKMIKLLLKAGAPIEAQGRADMTPLQTAASQGKINAVRKLLAEGAHIHAPKDDILCHACEKKNSFAMVELLLQAGATVNVQGGWRNVTPLHVATEHNQVKVVKRLLEAGADIHARDGSGWTPFLNAALRSGVEIIQLLIDAGADVKAIDSEGRSAYDLASKWGKPEVAEFLKRL